MLDNRISSAEDGTVHELAHKLASDLDWSYKTGDAIRNKNKRTALIIGIMLFFLTIVRIALVRFHVDPNAHFYTVSIVSVFDYVVAALIVAVYIGSLFFYKYKYGTARYPTVTKSFVQGTQTLVFTAAIAGFMLAASAVLQIWNIATTAGNELSTVPYMTYMTSSNSNNVLFDIFILITAVLSSIYFFRTAARTSDTGTSEIKYSQRYIILSLMPVIWAFLNTFKIFYDMSRAVNSPVRIYELMCFLILSLYFVSETRMLIGRLELAKYFTFAYIAAIITALSAIPNLILSSFWIMQTNDGHIIYAVQIAFALYISARIYSQLRYGKFGIQPNYDSEEKQKIIEKLLKEIEEAEISSGDKSSENEIGN